MERFNLSQDFVHRVTTTNEDDPGIAGGTPAPLPTQDLDWLKRFHTRLLELGLSERDAEQLMRAFDPESLDFTQVPREAAENELEQWKAD